MAIRDVFEREILRREAARRRLSDFLRYRFRMERRALLWSWHLDYLCEILEAVTRRELLRTIINIPPRFLKSELVSQSWQAWMIGREDGPRSSMLSAGATAQLAERDSRRTLQILQSEWYKVLFPDVKVTREAMQEWETEKFSTRNAAGAGGTITGRGGQHLLWDDLLLADEANSELVRVKKNQWLGETFRSRLDDQVTGTITGIMQRLHEDDPTGYLLRQMKNPDADQYEHIVIPLIAPRRTVVQMPRVCGGKIIKVREAGELLHPERIGLKEAKALRVAMQANFDGQYQQIPVKQEGDMLKPGRLVKMDGVDVELGRKWGIRPSFYMDWATKEKETQKDDPDFSVIAVMGVDEMRRVWILEVWAQQAAPQEVIGALLALKRKWEPVRVKGEDGALLNLYQSMVLERCRATGDACWIEGIRPARDKVMRAVPLQNLLNTGQICVPAGAQWLPAVEDEFRKFPRGSHDDRVDAIAYGCADVQDMRQGEAPRHEKYASEAMLRRADQEAIRTALNRASAAAKRGDDPIASARRAG